MLENICFIIDFSNVEKTKHLNGQYFQELSSISPSYFNFFIISAKCWFSDKMAEKLRIFEKKNK